MKIEVKGLKLNYKVYGQGEPLIVLHGWGSSLEEMGNVIDKFKEEYTVYALDLPGFGLSEKPEKSWGIYDYEDCVTKFIENMNLDGVTLVGHSLGGCIAMCLAYTRIISIKSVFLIGSIGVKRKVKTNDKLKILLFKGLGKVIRYLPVSKIKKKKIVGRLARKIGSTHYVNAKGSMRDTYVKIINSDVENLMPKILAPVVIVWGEDDQVTNLEDAQIMNGLIRGSKLRIVKNAGHNPYDDNKEEFDIIIDEEIKRLRETTLI